VVLADIAKEEEYTKDQAQQVIDPCKPVLAKAGVFTVRNLRKLAKERIETLDLPSVVTEYLLRVNAGGKQ
jgi:hypothetical protein